jgi:hypothetical protein
VIHRHDVDKAADIEGQLARVKSILSLTYLDDGVWIYLHNANRHLDGRTPMEAIYMGDGDRVIEVVTAIEGAAEEDTNG